MARPKAYLTADEHAKLSPETQTQYEPHAASGGFMFGLEPVNGWRLEDVDGVSSALTKERALARSLSAKFKDLDPDVARSAMTRLAELETEMEKSGGKLTKEERESLRKSMQEAFDKELQKANATNLDLDSQLRDYISEVAATAAIAEHKANLKLLMPHVKGAVKAIKGDDGKYRARVVGPDGNEMLSKVNGSAGNPMTASEFVGTVLKGEFPDAFPGTNSSGSGAFGSRNGSGGQHRIDPNLPPGERRKLAREQGLGAGTK